MLKRALIVASILVGVALFVWIIWVLEDQRLAKLTATAPGRVTQVVLHTDSESNDTTTIVHFTYLVEGRTLADQSSKPGDVSTEFVQGAPATVCYDPAKPADTEIYPTGAACPPR